MDLQSTCTVRTSLPLPAPSQVLLSGTRSAGVSELLLIVLLLIPKLLIYLVARRQSKVPISSIASFLLMKKIINFVAKTLKMLTIQIVVKRGMVKMKLVVSRNF
jgi:hypothetical protein